MVQSQTSSPANSWKQCCPITVLLQLPDDRNVRLEVINEGAVWGQESFDPGFPYQLKVVASQSTSLYRLTEIALHKLQQDSPAVAIAFQTSLITQLRNRIHRANRTIQYLLQ